MAKEKKRSICENDKQIKREINQKIIHAEKRNCKDRKNHKFEKKNTGSGSSTKNRINFIVLR